MKNLTLAILAILVTACGMEPERETTCAGEIDGITFTYSYELVDKGGLGGPAVRTRCSNDDPNAQSSTSGALFNSASQAAPTQNNCLMGADFVIQYDGGAFATVSTNTNYTLQDRVELGTINCQ